MQNLQSFKISSGKKLLDYRLGEQLDLDKVRSFFARKYEVKEIRSGPRHVFGMLEKNKITYFLKLSTSEGIGVITQNEFDWNKRFNEFFPNSFYRVPLNYEKGFYQKKYFYIIAEYFRGKLLCPLNAEKTNHLIKYILRFIELSKVIQKMPVKKGEYKLKFINKTRKWFEDIPTEVRTKYQVKILMELVEDGVDNLISKPRHGDFTPWHMIEIEEGGLGLLDGEHSLLDSVESYDICYLIQRIFSVLKNSSVALKIYDELLKKDYDFRKLQTVLAARAIGGFLDESLRGKEDYNFARDFKDWVISLN